MLIARTRELLRHLRLAVLIGAVSTSWLISTPVEQAEAADCLRIKIADLSGPARLESGVTGAYQVTLQNPNEAEGDDGCSDPLTVMLIVSGSLHPSSVGFDPGFGCIAPDSHTTDNNGGYWCTASRFNSGTTAVIRLNAESKSSAAGKVLVMAWPTELSPSSGDNREFEVNRVITGLRIVPNLSIGSTGTNVTALQYLLNEHGADVAVDGDFGPQTAQAVRDFQTNKGITADGSVERPTWTGIYVDLKKGDEGDAVRAVQSLLAGTGMDVEVDGDFGPQTDAAVKSYQQAKLITADGIVNARTWDELLVENQRR